MYSATFVSDRGDKYLFGVAGNTVFDMDIGDGVSVNIGTSQGFSQVGETVESQTVQGRTITVKGVVYGNIPERKQSMRKALAPFSAGRLTINDKYYTRVHVKSAPSFSPVNDNGKFTLQLFAPFPFFYSVEGKSVSIGGVTPLFSFPVNYAEPHQFGEKASERYTNVYNSGDVKVPYDLYLQSTGISSNINIVNLNTFAFLKINGVLSAGDTIHIYRDEANVLRAELQAEETPQDIISWIDEESTLFEINVGDNLILATDDEGGTSLIARFTFNPAVVAVYES